MAFLRRFSDNVVTTLTDAATIAVDMSLGPHFQVTLGGNRTLGNPTNAGTAKEVWIAVAQDGSGGRTLAFDTDWVASDSTTTVNSTASAVSIIYAVSRDFGSGVKWYYSVEHASESGGGGGSGVNDISFTSTKTANYTAAISEFVIVDLVNSSGDITVTLPTASGNTNKRVGIIILGSANGRQCVADGNASETINGSLTYSLDTDYESVVMQSTGSNWLIVG